MFVIRYEEIKWTADMPAVGSQRGEGLLLSAVACFCELRKNYYTVNVGENPKKVKEVSTRGHQHKTLPHEQGSVITACFCFYWTTVTFAAANPFGPFSTSNSTWSPSFKLL